MRRLLRASRVSISHARATHRRAQEYVCGLGGGNFRGVSPAEGRPDRRKVDRIVMFALVAAPDALDQPRLDCHRGTLVRVIGLRRPVCPEQAGPHRKRPIGFNRQPLLYLARSPKLH